MLPVIEALHIASMLRLIHSSCKSYYVSSFNIIAGESGTKYDDLMTRLNREFDWKDAITAITEDDWIEEVQIIV